MTNYNLDEIRNAVKILELPDSSTIGAIKDHFKKSISQWHPDKCQKHPDECKEMAQKVNKAYEMLMRYCLNYRISFKKEDIEKTLARDNETWWLARFGDDPIWGR